VYQDDDFGVIGIRCNTFLDNADHTAQAEVIMTRHFPEGHEIVRAEDVVESQRTLDFGRKTQIDAEPYVRILSGRREILPGAVKVGVAEWI
jgi:hypothetical protein